MSTATDKQSENGDVLQKRLDILAGATLKEVDRMNSAIKMQDLLRAKIGKWNGSETIRKWRQAR